MKRFMVERHLPGITMDSLQAAGLRAKSCSAEMTDEGTPVRWVRSVFAPDSERCFCTFEAPDQEAVADVNRRANIPYLKITPVLEMGDQT